MTPHRHIHSTNNHAKYPSTPFESISSLDHHERVVGCPSVHPQIIDSSDETEKGDGKASGQIPGPVKFA